MATGRGNQLTKQVGEFLVAAELARRGWLAAVLSGNTPEFDLIATNVNGRSVPVQVKAITGASWQFDVTRFAEVSFDGDRQVVGALARYPANLVCVLVVVGSQSGADQFFVLPMRTLQQLLAENHRAWLAKHGGVRPRNPKSTHTALSVKQVEGYRDHWVEIESAVGS
jgi:hypothetical protein